MRASLATSFAAAYGLAASMATARSLAAVHASCRKMSPLGRSHSSRNLAIAAWPSGASVAGPVTSMFTLAMRVGNDGVTVSVTVTGCVERSTVISTLAEK
jgi:hypothetical protein